ncbi:MAG TPA: sigma 54-interacting transcriptional regulator, partial [Bryobacteraceae bacterium]|nr:sigma 54-interacting transcriptional regulator [Bryobacteraceae bacterium]
MRALLIGISEAVQGEVHRLEAAEISLGRGGGSTLRIPHRSVSREHCVLRMLEDRVEILDHGSHNGTFVNGLPVRNRVLADGDEVRIGEVAFLFRVVADGAAALSNPVLHEPSVSRTVAAPDVPLAREATTLVRLSEIARLVQQLYLERGSETHAESARVLLSAIFELIPSQAGALLLLQGQEPVPLAEYSVDPSTTAVAATADVIDQVLRTRAPACGLAGAVSWVAAPLLVSGRPVGILCLDSRGVRRDYGVRDLQMIAAVGEFLALAVENARDLEMLRMENSRLRGGGADSLLIGESAGMAALQAGILKVARTNTTVLIRGESGTGKELVARAIHRNSARSGRPFVAVNCAAIAETLMESEFFGHEKGAFTGAVTQRKGRLEMADGGTVFLDEIGELGAPLQAKLLRVLQEHEFERVGGSHPIKIDIRVIAATNRDLEKAMREGTFREDLFYRLNVVPLQVPPLRERRDDIALLAMHFARTFSEQTGRTVTGLSREARAVLVAYDWPGNVRELQNAIERAVVMGSSEVILPDDLPDALLDSAPATDAGDSGFHEAVRQYRRRVILAALERSGGNVAEAARTLKLHPVYLHRLITSLGLRQ